MPNSIYLKKIFSSLMILAVIALSLDGIFFAFPKQAFSIGTPLTNVTDTVTNTQISTSTSHKIDFTTYTTVPADGKILITFPSGFNVASAAFSAWSGFDGDKIVSVNGQIVTIIRNGDGTASVAGAKYITLTNITNSSSLGRYTLLVKTIDNQGTTLDGETASSIFTLTNQWAQTDWSGGSGQTNFSDSTKYQGTAGQDVWTNSGNLKIKIGADVVVGQPDFISNQANQGGSAGPNTLAGVDGGVCITGNKLLISDRGTNRVLIFNTIPTQNNANADVVFGQDNFTSTSSGTGLNRVNNLSDVSCEGDKMLVVDKFNMRGLMFNSIPTSNGAIANFALTHAVSDWFYAPGGYIGNNKLINSSANHAVLIWNSIPSSNVTYNVIIGWDTVSQKSNISAPTAANRLKSLDGSPYYDGSKLLIPDTGNHRVLIFNSLPTSHGASADVVIGQADFTSGSINQGGSVGANTINYPRAVFSDGTRLFIADGNNNRVLIYNTLPTQNNASADIVLGQPDFTSATNNNGGIGSGTLSAPNAIYSDGTRLAVYDLGNKRVLLYNLSSKSSILTSSLYDAGEEVEWLQIDWNASTPTNSSINVEVSLDQGSTWSTVTDGQTNLGKSQYLQYRLTLANTDGLSSPTFQDIAITFKKSEAPASFDITAPADNTASNSVSKPTFTWQASADYESGLAKYQLYIHDILVQDNISTSGTEYTLTNAQVLSEGSHAWYIKALDNLGNSRQSSSVYTYIYDSTAPTETTLSFGTITSNAIVVNASSTDVIAGLHSTAPYYFQETSTSSNTGWQTGTSWTHSQLSANTQYTYQVKVRDNVDTPNESNFTTAQSKYTLIQTPTAVSFDNIAVNNITISASGTLSNLTSGTSGVYFDETSGNSGGTDSNWTQTNSYQNTGLSENTQYTYKVQARNGNSTETSYTSELSQYTLADTPTNLTAAKPSNDNNKMNLTVDELPNAVAGQSGYYFYRAGDEANHNSGWVQTNTWQDTSFTCNTHYTWSVKYRNGNAVETSTASISSNSTTNYPYSCGTAFVAPPATVTGQVTTTPSQPATTVKYLPQAESATGQSSQQTFTKVEIPAGATTGATTVIAELQTISQINQTTGSAPLPANQSIVSNLIVNYKASSGGKTVKQFNKPITILFQYTEQDIKQYQENTLKVYYFDETAKKWTALPNSHVNTQTNTITATTTHFTLFAVMGLPLGAQEKKEAPIKPESAKEQEKTNKKQSEEKTKEQPKPTTIQPETKEPAKSETYVFNRIMRYGAKGKDVVKLQDLLKALGLFPKDIPSTGYFDVTTLQAVNKYQQEIMKINPCNCGVGPKTKTYLNQQKTAIIVEEKYVFTKDLSLGSQGEDVKQLQNRLKQEQFFPHWVKSTGWFGSVTEKSVKLFQKAHQLVEDGLVGQLIRQTLNSQ